MSEWSVNLKKHFKRHSSISLSLSRSSLNMSLALGKLKKRESTDASAKPKKKMDRFDGMSEEDVQRYTLEDILEPNLDLVFVGINPSLMAAHRGRYYAGPGNHFYKLLHASGLVPRFVSFEEDRKLLDYNIGLTNIVARATRSSADLNKTELKEGALVVREKLAIFKPKVAVFNGKCIYEVFAEKRAKSEFYFGLQAERVGDTVVWVVPSSSARCAHFPRMHDKLHFYRALKRYLSFAKGEESGRLDEAEFRFEGKCKQSVATTSKMWRRRNVSAFLHGGRVANKNTFGLDSSEENLQVVRATEFVVTEILTGNDDREPSKSDDGEIAAYESNTEEKRSRQEVKRYDATTSPMRQSNLKRSRCRKSPLRILEPRRNNDSMNFMDLIKKRLSEKKGEKCDEESCAKPATITKEAKKLKYANLRVKKVADGASDASETLGEAKDRE